MHLETKSASAPIAILSAVFYSWQRSIDYRHYLRELARKPQAVRQVLPELLRDLGAPFPAVWARLEAVHSPRDAARLFAKVLG